MKWQPGRLGTGYSKFSLITCLIVPVELVNKLALYKEISYNISTNLGDIS